MWSSQKITNERVCPPVTGSITELDISRRSACSLEGSHQWQSIGLSFDQSWKERDCSSPDWQRSRISHRVKYWSFGVFDLEHRYVESMWETQCHYPQWTLRSNHGHDSMRRDTSRSVDERSLLHQCSSACNSPEESRRFERLLCLESNWTRWLLISARSSDRRIGRCWWRLNVEDHRLAEQRVWSLFGLTIHRWEEIDNDRSGRNRDRHWEHIARHDPVESNGHARIVVDQEQSKSRLVDRNQWMAWDCRCSDRSEEQPPYHCYNWPRRCNFLLCSPRGSKVHFLGTIVDWGIVNDRVEMNRLERRSTDQCLARWLRRDTSSMDGREHTMDSVWPLPDPKVSMSMLSRPKHRHRCLCYLSFHHRCRFPRRPASTEQSRTKSVEELVESREKLAERVIHLAYRSVARRYPTNACWRARCFRCWNYPDQIQLKAIHRTAQFISMQYLLEVNRQGRISVRKMRVCVCVFSLDPITANQRREKKAKINLLNIRQRQPSALIEGQSLENDWSGVVCFAPVNTYPHWE